MKNRLHARDAQGCSCVACSLHSMSTVCVTDIPSGESLLMQPDPRQLRRLRRQAARRHRRRVWLTGGVCVVVLFVGGFGALAWAKTRTAARSTQKPASVATGSALNAAPVPAATVEPKPAAAAETVAPVPAPVTACSCRRSGRRPRRRSRGGSPLSRRSAGQANEFRTAQAQTQVRGHHDRRRPRLSARNARTSSEVRCTLHNIRPG